MSKYLAILVLALGITSCEKDEIPVEYTPEPLSINAFNTQVEMGSDYRYRIYYDLESDSVVSVHEKTDWDLSFDCGENGHLIHLNSSKFMNVRKVEGLGLTDVFALEGEGPFYDSADGQETAIGDWRMQGAVYIIDRGVDATGVPQGKAKLEIVEVSDAGYEIRYADLFSSEITNLYIPKDQSRNRVHLSFSDGQVDIEPPKDSWDIVFTHYTLFFDDLFGQEDIYYLVAGALGNPNGVQALRLDETDFDSIDRDYLDAVILSNYQDAIGYDWKRYDLANDVYTILDNAFAVRTVEGNLYKLQFTSFVDATGERGAPAFRAALIP